MKYTYRQLLKQLQEMPEARLDDNVTAWDHWKDEFVPVIHLAENKEGGAFDTDVLDYGHRALELNYWLDFL